MPSYPPIGRCIYCGKTAAQAGPLTKEHIIAEALNGVLVLPEASCATCQATICKFEQIFARNMFGGLRWRRGFNSKRTRAKRDHTRRGLFGDADGNFVEAQVPADNYPGMYVVPVLPPPGILIGEVPSDTNPEIKVVPKVSMSEVRQFAGTAPHFAFGTYFNWGAFTRTYAKTAHAFLVAQVGMEGYEPFLPALILGESLHLSHYVGGFMDHQVPSGHDLALLLWPDSEGPLLIVEVTLLKGHLPPYQVVAGRVTDSSKLRRQNTDDMHAS